MKWMKIIRWFRIWTITAIWRISNLSVIWKRTITVGYFSLSTLHRIKYTSWDTPAAIRTARCSIHCSSTKIAFRSNLSTIRRTMAATTISNLSKISRATSTTCAWCVTGSWTSLIVNPSHRSMDSHKPSGSNFELPPLISCHSPGIQSGISMVSASITGHRIISTVSVS